MCEFLCFARGDEVISEVTRVLSPSMKSEEGMRAATSPFSQRRRDGWLRPDWSFMRGKNLQSRAGWVEEHGGKGESKAKAGPARGQVLRPQATSSLEPRAQPPHFFLCSESQTPPQESVHRRLECYHC